VRGGGFIGAAEGALTCGPGAPRGRRWHRAAARLGVELKFGSRLGTDLTGRWR
jgi:hypothetical protein